jgi:hypothetical protein
MTPHERSEALLDELLGTGLPKKCAEWLPKVEAAITEHVRASLADDDGTLAAIIRGPGAMCRTTKTEAEEIAQEVLAALRRKALGE